MENKIVDFMELMQLVKDEKVPEKIKKIDSDVSTELYHNKYSNDDIYSKDITNLYLDSFNNSWMEKLIIEPDTKFEILDDNDNFQKIDKLEYDNEGTVYIPNLNLYLQVNQKERHLIFPAINKLIENQEKIIERLAKDE